MRRSYHQKAVIDSKFSLEVMMLRLYTASPVGSFCVADRRSVETGWRNPPSPVLYRREYLETQKLGHNFSNSFGRYVISFIHIQMLIKQSGRYDSIPMLIHTGIKGKHDNLDANTSCRVEYRTVQYHTLVGLCILFHAGGGRNPLEVHQSTNKGS